MKAIIVGAISFLAFMPSFATPVFHESPKPGTGDIIKVLALKGQKRINLKDISSVRQALWEKWRKELKNISSQNLIKLEPLDSARTGKLNLPDSLEPNAVMPYYWGTKGTFAKGRNVSIPTYIYIHGSGPKAQEWAAGIGWCKVFADAPSRYFIPQIPNEGAYYRWWQRSKQWAWKWLWNQLMQDETIDPNRIYLFGISEGGYGSQRLASFYADYLAAVGPMAGGEPLQNCPPENIGNIGFSLLTGEKDFMFGRNLLTHQVSKELDSLQNKYPEEYAHRVNLITGMGHGIDYRPTTPWLQQFRRNPWPKHFIWEDYEMDGNHRKGFYNLRVDKRPSDSIRTRYDVTINENTIHIQAWNTLYTSVSKEPNWGVTIKWNKTLTATSKAALTLFLDEHLVDLSQKVRIIYNEKLIFNGKVNLSEEAMSESLHTFGDPMRIYPAAIKIYPQE